MRDVIDHLRTLVAADSTNPPRAIPASHPAVAHCADALAESGFDCTLDDLGDGCVRLFGVRGRPDVLVNCHLDTVPACPGWSGDPLALRVESGAAIGLGACDVKGAAAAILAACRRAPGDAAVLFTTDEESGSSRCVRSFLDNRPRGLSRAIVCEPTGCGVVDAHRGLLSVEGVFSGASGHASRGATDSAVHQAVRWSAKALEWHEREAPESRFSIGVIEGGVKPNMTAASARVRFGLRPPIGESPAHQYGALRALANGARVLWTERFEGPALESDESARVLADRLGAPMSAPVDFWTEASLFASAGMSAVVFGPGSIAYAHAPDEQVPLEDLERAAACFQRLFSGGSR